MIYNSPLNYNIEFLVFTNMCTLPHGCVYSYKSCKLFISKRGSLLFLLF